jgi:hypothetical protein
VPPSSQVNGKDLPLGDFGVQRPIELVEKELTDTVYYTREVMCVPLARVASCCKCETRPHLRWLLTESVSSVCQLDGDVKYFLKKKSAESGPRPLWPLTCHGDDNCQSLVAGDTSFEELKLQVAPEP